MSIERQSQNASDPEPVWQVEILPTQAKPPPRGSGLIRSVIAIAVVAGATGLLALLLAFAATIALIALPVALIAGLSAWLGIKWRAAHRRPRDGSVS